MLFRLESAQSSQVRTVPAATNFFSRFSVWLVGLGWLLCRLPRRMSHTRAHPPARIGGEALAHAATGRRDGTIKRMFKFAPLVLLVFLSACATGDPVRVEGIKVASAQAVTACQYLDTVYGTSSWYGLFAEKGIENARLSAFDKAQKVGGSHIVWEPQQQGYGSSQVTGKVYGCAKGG